MHYLREQVLNHNAQASNTDEAEINEVGQDQMTAIIGGLEEIQDSIDKVQKAMIALSNLKAVDPKSNKLFIQAVGKVDKIGFTTVKAKNMFNKVVLK